MRHRGPVVLVCVAGLCGCGGDDGGLDVESFGGAYTVTMVVGEASSDPAANPMLLPRPGDSFTERWDLDCDASSCVLTRPEGGVVLGDLDDLVLAPPPEPAAEAVEALTGRAEGVHAEPALEEPGPCEGSPVQQWTVRVEVSHDDDVLSGSVIRVPDALRDTSAGPDCYGIDLTLGLSGVRR